MQKILSNLSSKKRNHKLPVLIILLISILVTFTIYQPIYAADTTENIVLNITYGQTDARNMLELINDFRTGDDAWYWNKTNTEKVKCSNLQKLKYDYGLEQIAMQRAAEIALMFDHTRPNGDSCFSYTYQNIMSSGENIAAGLASYQETFNRFQENDEDYSGQGHRRNMLGSNYTAVGIGHVVYNGIHYWVQEFGTSTSSIANTDALNTSKNVTIPFSSSFVSSLTRTNNVGIISVVKGKTINVPEGRYNLITTEVWPSKSIREITTNSTWTVKDTSIATISNGIITGNSTGTTTISTTVLGKTFTITLHVLSKECTSHTYDNGTITLEPTCTETGLKTYVCSNCGYSYTEEVAKLGHDWSGEVTPIKNPTCTEDGYGNKYCKREYCKRNSFMHWYIPNVTIPATGHTEVIDTTEKKATCTEDGMTKSSHCKTCNATLSTATTIPKLGHSWKQTGNTWSADYKTCTINLTCENDSSHTMNILATIKESVIPSTCTTKGTHTYTATATYDGKTYSDTKTVYLDIDSSAHPKDMIETVDAKEPTCTEDGHSSYQICKACNKKLTTESVISATGHEFTPSYIWSDDGTSCKLKLTCTNDTTHVISDIKMTVNLTSNTEPTCTTAGSKTYTASYTYNGTLYKDTKTVFIAAGHNYQPSYSWNTEKGTCTLTLTCTRNQNHVISDLDMSVKSNDTIPATCVSTGKRTYTATYTYNSVTYTSTKTVDIPKNAENHQNIQIDSKVDPTCIKTGKTQGSHCEACNEIIKPQTEIPAYGHDYSEKIISENTLKSAATYDSPAIYYYSCSRCGKTGTNTFTYGNALIKSTPDVTVSYHTHIQTLGDSQGVKSNGQMAGTSGMAKRLENIWIKVDGNPNLGIQYTTHCQSYGWMPWSANGESNGTSGEAKRLEAIKIQLTRSDASKYDVYYRVHAQSYGWLGWAKNGEPSGTAGYGKRLEGIQIVVLKKESSAPGLDYAGIKASATVHNNNSYIAKTASAITIPGNTETPNISYRTHVQSFGWQTWKYNGDMSGTSGKAKRLEGINIKLSNCPYSGGIEYRTHIQSYGWEKSWKQNGAMSGTSGEAKRLEAIQIRLTDDMAKHYDVYYRVHAQSYGWLNWAKNGEEAGTAGYAKRLEGIQIILVPKGQNAPGRTYLGITSIQNASYIRK